MSVQGEWMRRQNSRDKLLEKGVRPPPPERNTDTFLYVYGTLRPGGKVLHRIPGRMYSLGSYPGVTLETPGDNYFIAEKVLVSPTELKTLDQYEGYRPDNPERSLYLRVPYMDGEIYVYNFPMNDRALIKGGDWLKYTARTVGSQAESMGVTAWDYEEIGDAGSSFTNLPSHFTPRHNTASASAAANTNDSPLVSDVEESAGYDNVAEA